MKKKLLDLRAALALLTTAMNYNTVFVPDMEAIAVRIRRDITAYEDLIRSDEDRQNVESAFEVDALVEADFKSA